MITAATTSTSPVNYMGAISADSLLAYCSSRLRSIDDQVQTQFKKQEQYRAVTQLVNGIQGRFAAPAADGGVMEKGAANQTKEEWCADTAAQIDELVKAAPPGSDAYNKAKDIQARFHSTAQGQDCQLSKEECKLYADELSNLAKELGSSAELEMINLNSLMSQRQTAIQLVTNMMSSLNESQKSIAASLK